MKLFFWTVLWILAPVATQAQEALGSARLQISGTRLTLDPASQTVPYSTPTIVATELEGYDPTRGVLPEDLVVLGDFSGPEVDGVLTLETVPNEPFRIPRLRLEGEYLLDNVRLVQGEEILAYAEPRSAKVNVAQILVTRVSSRALTADEINSYGLALDADNFQALNLTFAFGVAGNTIDYNLPLVFNAYGPQVDWAESEEIVRLPQFSDDARRTVTGWFSPPTLLPFRIHLEHPEPVEIPHGGCDADGQCRDRPPEHPMVGVLLFPTELSLLHQFFSVALMAQNAAPDGDLATIEGLTARIQLPSGLRLGETDPPALTGSPVPVVDPGADGELGTADDVPYLAAQATGESRYLVEGRKEGTHVVHFDLSGTLAGLPTGPQPIVGRAQGAVTVRDPTLAVKITHPRVVRADIEYWLDLAVTNLGTAPVNQISISFPSYALSGVAIVGEAVQTIPTLDPGESATVEFLVRPERTGAILASAVKAGSSIVPSFAYSLKVGVSGSLSPDSLALPEETQGLPRSLVRPALALLGLGYSLAESPPSLRSGLPRVAMDTVNERIYRLKQSGINHDLGEELFDVVALLAANWAGDRDWDWDVLARETRTGGEMEAAVASLLGSESASPRDAFDRFAATTHYLGPQAVLAAGAGLEVSSRTSGKAVSGAPLGPDRVRELPFARLYGLAGAEMVTLAAPEDGGYRVRLTSPSGGSAELHLLVPDAAGELAAVRFTSLSLAAGAEAELEFEPGQAAFDLAVDDDGDDVIDRVVAPDAVETVTPRPFEVIVARGADDDPSGHVVAVLFTEDVDLESLHPADPDHFTVPGTTSNGGLVEAERSFLSSLLAGGETIENPFEGLRNPRLVRVIFDNPLSPLHDNFMTVSGLTGISGRSLPTQVIEVQPSPRAQPGSMVEGVVFGPDGQPVAGAEVVLYQADKSGRGQEIWCSNHPTAKTTTDANGFYHFDYVRQTECGTGFSLKAQDPGTGAFGRTASRVVRTDTTFTLNIVMPRRGKLRGRVTYADGTVPATIRVVASNRDFNQGRLAHVDEDGYYDVDHVVVGTVTLSADDGAGNFVFRTVELPSADVTVEQDLVIIARRRDEPAPGSVRGTVTDEDGLPVFDAYLALYVDSALIGVERSDPEGRFDFGLVPAGLAQIEAFDEASVTRRQSAAQLLFEVEPDLTSEVEVRVLTVSGAIEGHVYRKRWNGELTALAGAVVWIEGTPYNTVTDAAGHYLFEDVFAGEWKVSAALVETGERAQGKVTITSAAESGGVPVSHDFHFQESLPDGGIVGRVLGYTGVPVAGATIHLAGGHESTRWHHETHTDDNGYFAIEDLKPGRYGVHAMKGGDGGVGWAEVLFPGHTASVEVRFRRGTVRVRTVARQADDSELPVITQLYYRSVEVTEWGTVAVARGYSAATTSAEDGTFEFDTLVGPYEVIAYNPFHQALNLNGYTGRVRGELVFDGEVAEHVITFEENGTIGGRVYEYDGETPSAGTVVELNGGGFSDFDVTTDEKGYFEFRMVPRGSYSLTALAEDGVLFRKARVSVAMRKAGDFVEVEIPLPEQGSVTGAVQTQDDDPVPGAVVTLREGAYPHRFLVQNADEEGFFAFHNVFAGPVTVDAQAPALGGLAGRSTAEVYFEGEEVATVVVLEATGEIIGAVVNPDDGLAVANATVRLHAGGSLLMETVSSDADGRYRFRLLPVDRTYQARVYDPVSGRRGRSAWIAMGEHNEVVEADTVLEVRGSVEGHFYDDDTDGTIPATTVRLHIPLRLTAFSTTDEDGFYEFGGIPEGDLGLYAREPEGRRHTSAAGTILEEDELVSLDLHLAATSIVFGRVLNPIGSADENGLFPNVNTRIVQGNVIGAGFDNPYSFDGVMPRRRFKVIAVENGGLRESQATRSIWEAGDDLEIDLRMPAIGSVTVEVFAADGTTPVSGADVQVSNRHATNTERFYGGTGAGNSVTFGDVREGQLWARATDPVNNLRGSATGTLSSEGESVTLSVSLEPTGTLRGRAVGPDGVTPAAFASVAVQRGGGWLFTEADEDGLFVVEPVRMGTYTVTVQDVVGTAYAERRGTLTQNLEVHDFGVVRLDGQDPRVVSIVPEGGSMNVPPTTPMVVTFSEPMDTTRGQSSLTLRKSGGGGVSVDRTWSADGTTVTLTPTSGALASGTAFDLTVKQEIYDVAGRELSWPVRSSFQTADVIPPAPIDVQPADGAVEVPISSSIYVLFSEPVDLASLSGSAFQLLDTTSGEGVTTTLQLRPGEREVILTPQLMPGIGRLQELYADRLMQLTIQGVRDLADNVMPAAASTTFWTVDETLPELAWLTPGEGEPFVSGQNVPIAVDATDNRGVARVDFTIGEWASSDSGSPFAWDIAAPVVDAVSDVEITAVVTDIFGNQRTSARTISVAPHANASPPEIGSACPFDGDLVAPGVEIPIPYTITDDESIESFWLEVDGERLEVTTPYDQAAADGTYLWAPPAGAAPGQDFDVRVGGRDFAGNVSYHAVLLSVPDFQVLTGDHTIDSAWSGVPLALGAGTHTFTEAVSFHELAVLHGAVVTTSELVLDVAATVRVDFQCGSRAEMSYLGYLGGHPGHPDGYGPEGIAVAQTDAGGSHGGSGLLDFGPGPVGEVYDSVYRPSLAGAGGSAGSPTSSNSAGAGGGAILIEAAELIVDGAILARGKGPSGFSPGGGAGGTVRLTAGTLSGTGTLDASGGHSQDCQVTRGTGGGGRVALLVDSFSGFDPLAQVTAAGGLKRCSPYPYAAPGTIFVKTLESTYGSLRVDQTGAISGRTVTATELPTLGSGLLTSIEAAGSDLWIAAGDFQDRWLGAWIELRDVSGAPLGTFEAVDRGEDGRLLLAGAGAVAAAVSYAGEYRFDETVALNGARLVAGDPVNVGSLTLSGEVEIEAIEAAELTVKSGSYLRPLAGGTLSFKISGRMTVEAGAVIDVVGLGYPSGNTSHPDGYAPEGIVGSTPDAGGSHGGAGRAHLLPGAAGEVYDSVYMPQLAGGGPAARNADGTQAGGAGGGVVFIEAGELVLDGSILALGSVHGGGGTVRVVAGSLAGAGLIDASGGDSLQASPHGADSHGQGGGGRVSLVVDQMTGFDPLTQTRVTGGKLRGTSGTNAYGAPGTVYVKTLESTHGRVVIDQVDAIEGKPFPATELPALAGGVVTAVEAAGADLWVTGEAGFRVRWLGAGMELFDAAGQSLGVFRVARLDESGRLLLEGAGSVAGAATFVGRYRFDEIVLRSFARLAASDPVDSLVVFASDVTLEGEVAASGVRIESGVTVTVPVLEAARFEVNGTMTIEAGARIDVTGLGYRGFGGSPGPAPPNVVAAPGNSGGNHGGYGGKSGDYSVPEVFDSVYLPRLGGGAGGDIFGASGGDGGGAVEIEAGHLVLDGEILARGASGGTGGSGGSILIRANQLSGSGLLDAQGVDGNQQGGGGGRIAIWADSLEGFDLSTQAFVRGGGKEGELHGGAGTLFARTSASTWGDLWIRHPIAGADVAPTELPAIGKATIGATAPDADDPASVWIEPADPAHQFSVGVVGMWARVNGVDHPVIGERLDRRGILLQGGAGTVAVGDVFLGIYKFDTVTVAGGVELLLRDHSEVAAWDVDADSQVTLLDVSPPVFQSVTPAAGSTLASGDEVTITVDVIDPETSVTRVAFAWAGQTFVDDAEPWSWTTRAPAVSTAGDSTLLLEAVDTEDNAASATHTFHLEPLPAADPPAVAFACPTPLVSPPTPENALLKLVPGGELDVLVDAFDPLDVERVEFFVDGAGATVATDFFAPYTYTLAAPPTAVEGDVLTLTARATNYAAVTSEVTIAVPVVERTFLEGDQTLDGAWNGQEIVLGRGTYTVTEPLDLAGLTLLSGAVVTTGTALVPLELATDELTVHCAAAIDQSALGFAPGGSNGAAGEAPAWVTPSGERSGGSHGGRGWDGTVAPPGEVFGSVYQPTLGGGGGGGNRGGAGGGVLTISAASRIVLAGEIRADGADVQEDMDRAGAGGGGAVLVDTARIVGGGRISAAGHDYHSRGGYLNSVVLGGGGGGGRVALYADDLIGFDPASQVDVTGGRRYQVDGTLSGVAAPGTIFVLRSASTWGELILNAYGESPDPATAWMVPTELPLLGGGAVQDLVDDGNGDAWLTGPAVFLPRWLGASVELRGADEALIGTYRAIDLDETGRLLLEGAAGLAGAVSWTGGYRFDSVRLLGGAGISTYDALGGPVELSGASVELGSPLHAGDLVVRAGTVVTASSGWIQLTADGTFTLEAGAVLDASARGYAGGTGGSGSAPGWVSPSPARSGGSHGGHGFSPTGSPGEVYDSVYRPTLAGGGGGGFNIGNHGGNGGGVVTVTGRDVVLDGDVVVTGQSFRTGPDQVGGGAGGTVVVEAETLSGGGRIDASGADYQLLNLKGGGGGGGRVALHVGDPSSFGGQVDVTGGVRRDSGGVPLEAAAAGTLFVMTQTSTYGELLLDGRDELPAGVPVPMTELPALGDGGVLDFTDHAGGLDAWLTGPAAFSPRWLGVRVELFDAGGASLGEFPATEIDGAGRLRLAGAAGSGEAATWRGHYRFDQIRVLGGASLEATDRVGAATVELAGTVDLGTSLDAHDLTIGAGAVVRSPEEELRLTAAGTLRIEAGALLDASGSGFAGGLSSQPGEAPAEVAAAESSAGGSHGGRGLDGKVGLPGELFDSVYQPVHAGGGGGGYNSVNFGGAGGGVMILEAAAVELDGEVRSRGLDHHPETTGSVAGAGAGGTVVIRSDSLTGGGVIDVAGGDQAVSPWGKGGAGGGGRVALEVASLGFDMATQVVLRGGTRFYSDQTVESHAAAGTAFVFDSSSTHGSLYVLGDAAGETAGWTALPAIGRDVVANPVAGAEPTDLWIEPAGAAVQLDWGVNGMWVRVGGLDYRVIEQGSGRRTMLLDGAAGLAAGEEYAGYYKFDTVTVLGGARLEVLDFSEVATWTVDADSEVRRPDQDPPVIGAVTPANGASFQAGDSIVVTAEVTDDPGGVDSGVESVTLHFAGDSLIDSEAPYEWTVTAPLVAADYTLTLEAVDPTGNQAVPVVRTIHVTAADAPTVTLVCPSDGALIAPSTGLDVFVDADHEQGIDRVEFTVDGVLAGTVTTAPYVQRVEAPATAVAGDVLTVEAVAYSTLGSAAAASATFQVVEGTVLAASTTIPAGDATHDGTTLVVAAGTLTIDGAHTFDDLVVLDGATVTHTATTAGAVGALDVDLTGRLYVACGGSVDADGRGYLAGTGHPNDPSAGAPAGVGGSHGGRGGLFDTAAGGAIYGDFFDPADPGAGGGGATASAGGGVVRLAAAGDLVIDGTVTARGDQDGIDVTHGAGGSIRLDGSTIRGLGTIDASGAGSAGASPGSGGGRVALYGAAIDPGLVTRARASGGDASTAQARGAAGTLFVKRDADAFGELHVVNVDAGSGSVASTQVTELPALGGTYELDRIVVDGAATVVTLDGVQVSTPAEVGAGSTFLPSYAPSVTITAPADSSALSSGEAFIATAQVDDVLGVLEVTETFDGLADVDSAAPFSWTETAPQVGAVTPFTVSVEATDLGGHVLTDSITVTVEPVAGNAPAVVLGGCPADQDRVVPGQVLTFPFSATDDEQVVSWTLRVDGLEVETQAVSAVSVSASPSWTVPIDATPSQTFTVRAEAVDQAAAVGFDVLQLAVAGSHLLGPANLDATLNGQALVLGPGTFTVTEPVDLASLRLATGAVVTGVSLEPLDLTVAGELRLQCGAAIDVTGQGLPRQQAYPGETVPGNGSGGSHIGVGGQYETSVVGSTYGSVYQPQEPGGGSDYPDPIYGRSGGGVVRISAVDVHVEAGSAIRANGAGYLAGDNTWARGGAGGSVWITASGLLSGDGTIEASGGLSGTKPAGSGGGGAVAVEYASSSGTVIDNLRAWGGENAATGGAGTVYLRSPASTFGDLVLDSGSVLGGRTELPSLGVGVAQSGSGADLLVTDLAAVPTYFAGHWVEVYDAASGDLKGTWQIAEITGASLTLGAGGGAPSVVPGDLWQGVYRFDSLTVHGDLHLGSEDPVRVEGTQEISGTLSSPTVTAQDLVLLGTLETRTIAVQNLVLRSGAVLTHPPTTDPASPASLSIETGDLVLESGAAIDVTGQGLPRQQAYPGETVPGNGSGGSHVGVGGQYLAHVVGSTYGSVYRPQEPGGGSDHLDPTYGRSGGGVVRISAVDVHIEAGSVIRANGAGYLAGDNAWARGGAGGSVWITASGVLSGDGTIEASGGPSGTQPTGSGGGGAVAVEYASWSGTVIDNLRAWGGGNAATGGAGTVYLRSPASTFGDLVLDSGSVLGGRTELPSLGVGVAQSGSGADLLVTDLTAVPAYFVGHWVEVYEAGTGLLKGTWRIGAVGGASLTLEDGASGAPAVALGDVWQGVYRFDSLTVRGDNFLGSEDPIRGPLEILGTVTARTLTAHDLVLRPGAVLAHPPMTDPAAPESLSIELTGGLTVEAGAAIDVTGFGFDAHETYPGESLPGTNSGGSHLGVGGQYGSNSVASTFGSVYRPREAGGGGQHATSGRPGGGVVRIAAAGVTVEGAIRANGVGYTGANAWARGGAGGSVWITTSGAVTGNGTIEAKGGVSGLNLPGSGGGGAIAIEHGSISAAILSNLNAEGGENSVEGGAGTVYVKGPTSLYGDLVIDSGTVLGGRTTLPALGVGLAQAGTAGDVLATDLGSVPAFFAGHWVEVYDGAGGGLKGTWRIADVDGAALTLEEGESGPVAVAPGDLWQGVYRFDDVFLAGDQRLESEDPIRVTGTQEVLGTVELRNVTAHHLLLRSGSALAHPPTTNVASPESLRIQLTGNLTLETGAAIDLTGLGFPRHQTYPGETVGGTNAGGSHLGVGGKYGTNAVGSTFGSVYRPLEPGGGSERSDATYGRAGGGVVQITAVDVALAAGSAIRANGAGSVTGDHQYTRGGAGGSVWIRAGGTISGDGTIEARGGDSGSSDLIGSGGGGAIAVEYAASAGTVLDNLRAWGGQVGVIGGAGTVYLFGPTSLEGDLIVDGGGITGQGTDLPALGSGTAAAGSSGALLVTDLPGAIPPFFVGHWVEISAADSTLKGIYRIAAVAGVSATLESELAETISVEPGDLWRGVYRFDTVTVTGGDLTSADPVFESGVELDLSGN